MLCSFKVGSGERDDATRVEDAVLDEGISSGNCGGSTSVESVVNVEDGEGLRSERSIAFRIDVGANETRPPRIEYSARRIRRPRVELCVELYPADTSEAFPRCRRPPLPSPDRNDDA